jgi:hypothetical protein
VQALALPLGVLEVPRERPEGGIGARDPGGHGVQRFGGLAPGDLRGGEGLGREAVALGGVGLGRCSKRRGTAPPPTRARSRATGS